MPGILLSRYNEAASLVCVLSRGIALAGRVSRGALACNF